MLVKIKDDLYLSTNHIVAINIYRPEEGGVRVIIETVQTTVTTQAPILIILNDEVELASLLSNLNCR
ncbi:MULTISPECIES: hypothetical protein [Acinetobacter]|uniref:Uncharacterized protein n=2 Tax=Acinetobacter TaxID=469 RepID=N8W9M1_9GAMM|nr:MULTISPECIES: hypothetical protein [Acinetobacter]ENU92022.1 hypothetical protein F971_03115 [Acinetobacter vivianii]ENW93348.1 hypothetical protein F904_01472 [Acinetobacter dispersus]